MPHASDRVQFQDLRDLASLGSWGKYPGNMHTEMIARLPPHRFSEPHVTDLPMKLIGNRFLQVDQSLLWPHVMFSDIYHNYPESWRKRVAAPADVMEKFWRDMADTPAMARNPVKQRPSYMTKAIPIRFHGDGVPVTGVGKAWNKMADVFSWTHNNTNSVYTTHN